MANQEHLNKLKQGVTVWNKWRVENRHFDPDLSGIDLRLYNLGRADLSRAILSDASLMWANLSEANLRRAALSGATLIDADLSEATLSDADLRRADLSKANLSGANLSGADLSGANLSGADLRQVNFRRANLRRANLIGDDLSEANLSMANLSDANLSKANLSDANLSEANLGEVDLSGANLGEADLSRADLSGANLSDADLRRADLRQANLSGADLRQANLGQASLVETNLENAVISGCQIYGISAWNLKTTGVLQSDLVITSSNEPIITVDNLEVAQFVYLLLHNEKIRDIIDTITTKAVLILGRFTEDRKAVLDAIREELRKQDKVPMLFDFDPAENQNLTDTVTTLARMSSFIIADLTDPSSIPHELAMIIPTLSTVAIQPVLELGDDEIHKRRAYAMFRDWKNYTWVLPIYEYQNKEQLLETLLESVVKPAEAKTKELRAKS